MKIDHIGYAVKKIDEAVKTFGKLGFSFGAITEDVHRNIRLVFGEKDGYCIELISPIDREKASPVDTYLGKVGATPYHICYRTNDLDEKITELQASGFRVIVAPEDAVAFDGRRVVFMMERSVGLLELVER